MKRISTHILDTTRGKPAASIPVRLERQDLTGTWRELCTARTDTDGRCAELLPENQSLSEGVYRITFATADYFSAQGVQGLYPFVEITFLVRNGESHFHIPLLLSPNGYSTYRGS